MNMNSFLIPRSAACVSALVLLSSLGSHGQVVMEPEPPFTPFQTLLFGTALDLPDQATRIRSTAVETNRFLLDEAGSSGGARVAMGDTDGDGIDDIIVGAGAGGGPHVRVISGTDGTVLADFFAFETDFRHGVFVAAGDTNQDGFDDIIVGADAGGGPHVRVFDGKGGAELRSFLAYSPKFTGGVRVATGDLNGDGHADIITGAGPGGGPHVRVFDGTSGAELRSFFAFDPAFTGGIFVAGAHADSDEREDIIVGGAVNGRPVIRIFGGGDVAADGKNPLLGEFAPFPDSFSGGVRVAAGDVNGDGAIDIVASPDGDRNLVRIFSSGAGRRLGMTPDVGFAERGGGLHVAAGTSAHGDPLLVFGAGPGGPPLGVAFEIRRVRDGFTPLFETETVNVALGDHTGDSVPDIILASGPGDPANINVFDGSNGLFFGGFSPYQDFTGGVYVTSADLRPDGGKEEIITGPGEGMAPSVRIFDGETAEEVASFFVYDPSFMGGVRVATGDINGDGTADIITGAGPGGGPHVKVFSGVDLQEINSFFAYDSAFTAGVFVAAGDVNGDGVADIITGPGAGGGPHIRIFDGNNSAELRSFFAYDPAFTGGVRVAAGDVTGDGFDDVVVTPSSDGPSEVRIFDGRFGDLIATDPVFNAGEIPVAVFDRPAPDAQIEDLVIDDEGRVHVRAQVARGLFLHLESGAHPSNLQPFETQRSLGEPFEFSDDGSVGQDRWFLRSRGR